MATYHRLPPGFVAVREKTAPWVTARELEKSDPPRVAQRTGFFDDTAPFFEECEKKALIIRKAQEVASVSRNSVRSVVFLPLVDAVTHRPMHLLDLPLCTLRVLPWHVLVLSDDTLVVRADTESGRTRVRDMEHVRRLAQQRPFSALAYAEGDTMENVADSLSQLSCAHTVMEKRAPKLPLRLRRRCRTAASADVRADAPVPLPETFPTETAAEVVPVEAEAVPVEAEAVPAEAEAEAEAEATVPAEAPAVRRAQEISSDRSFVSDSGDEAAPRPQRFSQQNSSTLSSQNRRDEFLWSQRYDEVSPGVHMPVRKKQRAPASQQSLLSQSRIPETVSERAAVASSFSLGEQDPDQMDADMDMFREMDHLVRMDRMERVDGLGDQMDRPNTEEDRQPSSNDDTEPVEMDEEKEHGQVGDTDNRDQQDKDQDQDQGQDQDQNLDQDQRQDQDQDQDEVKETERQQDQNENEDTEVRQRMHKLLTRAHLKQLLLATETKFPPRARKPELVELAVRHVERRRVSRALSHVIAGLDRSASSALARKLSTLSQSEGSEQTGSTNKVPLLQRLETFLFGRVASSASESEPEPELESEPEPELESELEPEPKQSESEWSELDEPPRKRRRLVSAGRKPVNKPLLLLSGFHANAETRRWRSQMKPALRLFREVEVDDFLEAVQSNEEEQVVCISRNRGVSLKEMLARALGIRPVTDAFLSECHKAGRVVDACAFACPLRERESFNDAFLRRWQQRRNLHVLPRCERCLFGRIVCFAGHADKIQHLDSLARLAGAEAVAMPSTSSEVTLLPDDDIERMDALTQDKLGTLVLWSEPKRRLLRQCKHLNLQFVPFDLIKNSRTLFPPY
ncbi:MAG: hypothetical protein MHM6MM_006995 [Cercozoa sp. M6MM]